MSEPATTDPTLKTTTLMVRNRTGDVGYITATAEVGSDLAGWMNKLIDRVETGSREPGSPIDVMHTAISEAPATSEQHRKQYEQRN